MDYLVSFITTILSFLIGYFLGKQNYQSVGEIAKDIKKKIDNTPVGVVRRPTQEQLLKRKDPLYKTIDEGNKAMKETLDNIQGLKQ